MPKKNAHLAFDDRCAIEEGLGEGLSFRAIVLSLDVSPTTVSNEVKAGRHLVRSKTVFGLSPTRCARYGECEISSLCRTCASKAAACKRCKAKLCCDACGAFEWHVCAKLDRAPLVCDPCKKKRGCSLDHARYKASKAHAAYQERLSLAHAGISCTREELASMVSAVRRLLSQGQSLEAIWAAHARELPVGVRTFCNCMDKGAMGMSNMELPRKVRYRPRKKDEGEPAARHDMAGRTYADWLALGFRIQALAVEMDCVEGRKADAKAILALHFVRFEFQAFILLERKVQANVKAALDHVEEGCEGAFGDLVPVLKPDRGSEFLDFEALEAGVAGGKRTSVYYCDPAKPGQKGSAEKNHEELRKILPKGTVSFDSLTQEKVSLICSHVNSYPRPSLGGKTPFDLASQVLPESLLARLGIMRVAPDDVVMKPYLIK